MSEERDGGGNQGLFVVTLSGSEESSPNALREMLRFAQHDRMSEKYDFEKVLGSNTIDSHRPLTSSNMRQTISAAEYSRKSYNPKSF